MCRCANRRSEEEVYNLLMNVANYVVTKGETTTCCPVRRLATPRVRRSLSHRKSPKLMAQLSDPTRLLAAPRRVASCPIVHMSPIDEVPRPTTRYSGGEIINRNMEC